MNICSSGRPSARLLASDCAPCTSTLLDRFLHAVQRVSSCRGGVNEIFRRAFLKNVAARGGTSLI
jgi:hypothetical protein